MATLVFFMLVFLVVSIVFLFIHLMMGKMIRPSRPDAEKLTIYECGEPTVGTAWIQFDLRYYVVALLFVIFDVEVAFFFPWAITFGKANELARSNLPEDQRIELSKQLRPASLPSTADVSRPTPASTTPLTASEASSFAWIAIFDIFVFFGVLLVGFAYLWKRGDIDWVKALGAERLADPAMPASVLPKPVPSARPQGATV